MHSPFANFRVIPDHDLQTIASHAEIPGVRRGWALYRARSGHDATKPSKPHDTREGTGIPDENNRRVVSHENPIEIEDGVRVVALPNAASQRLLRLGDFHRLSLWPNAAS